MLGIEGYHQNRQTVLVIEDMNWLNYFSVSIVQSEIMSFNSKQYKHYYMAVPFSSTDRTLFSALLNLPILVIYQKF